MHNLFAIKARAITTEAPLIKYSIRTNGGCEDACVGVGAGSSAGTMLWDRFQIFLPPTDGSLHMMEVK